MRCVGAILFCLLLLICGGCASKSGNEATPTLDDLNWIVADWRGKHSGSGEFYESWTRTGDHFVGSGYQVADGDTIFGESLRIEDRDGALFYVAGVSHNASEIGFLLVNCSKHRAVFENPDHDFPQRITYELSEDGTLYVRAGLINEEQGRVLQFFFERVK